MKAAIRLTVFAVAAGLIVIVVFFDGLGGNVIAIIPSRCTIGLAGTAASVTAEGSGASAWCSGTIAASGTGWYLYADGTQPGGAVICQIPARGMTLTVRDQGALNLEGTQLCQELPGQQ